MVAASDEVVRHLIQAQQRPVVPELRAVPGTLDTMVSAREDIERVETGGGESERPIVSLKRGNHPAGPRGEKGMPCHGLVAALPALGPAALGSDRFRIFVE